MKKNKGAGGIIAIVVIVLLFAIGGFYLAGRGDDVNNDAMMDDGDVMEDKGDDAMMDDGDVMEDKGGDAMMDDGIKGISDESQLGDVEPQVMSVKYTSEGFITSTFEISKGTEVTFVNESGNSMWVASNPHPTHTDFKIFDQKSSGDSYTFRFDEPGTYAYHNHLRPKDGGTITVK